MRLFMIAAALSAVALGFSGCAMTTGGCGCMAGGSCIEDSCSSGCSDSSSNCGCEAAGTSDCGCESGGDSRSQSFGDNVPTGDAGCGCAANSNSMQGLYTGNIGVGPRMGGGMSMSLMGRGTACGGPSAGGLLKRDRKLGCGRFGCGVKGICLACRAKGDRSDEVFADSCDGCDDRGCNECEVGHVGLFAKIKAANALAEASHIPVNGMGCGARGCGPHGCGACRGRLQSKFANPYGGAVPHTTQPPAGYGGQGGAPSYAYPYYTTRGPRDFLMANPPTIGY